MSTGKIEYSPDYNSRVGHLREVMEKLKVDAPVAIGQAHCGKTMFEVYKERAEELEAENKSLREALNKIGEIANKILESRDKLDIFWSSKAAGGRKYRPHLLPKEIESEVLKIKKAAENKQ